ncbi:MAG: hypothetical protein PHX16_04430 [Syntrophaceticus sp.]|nr:hypothetical protein [Syntrophaceticus sp.]MDD3314653.1 hypothetical protein [Syntrophaceticus sp.]MDD4359896.1 hypothetical protein [Syntrophaceticus sp.]MDD4782871.1 hypothetical protein [Syntrophaceticus sp.]
MLKRKQDEYSDAYQQRGSALAESASSNKSEENQPVLICSECHTVICATRESEDFSLIGVESRVDLVP